MESRPGQQDELQATTESGQEVLFGAAETVSTAPPLQKLRTKVQMECSRCHRLTVCEMGAVVMPHP